ncbi:hypothetical protein GCM10010448_65860 [Streptomyces glomeratus]|uniref:Uncharacterized protein n=1 Tax=Streptomyces glomeratus TaxID=284452 RepID=A0ABP6M3F5_9ACTN
MFGAEEIFRLPAEGPAFYLGLRIGDTDLGLVAKTDPGAGAAPRTLSGAPRRRGRDEDATAPNR